MSATFPRSFVDLNRDHKELDPLLVKDLDVSSTTPKVTAGLGVIPRIVGMQKGIYESKISKKEVKDRLHNFYFPYHTKLREVVTDTHAVFQKSILLDCHSMPSNFLNKNSNKNLADVVLGDCFGSSCEKNMLFLMKKLFVEAGFKVDVNKPFSGGFITKNYSDPSLNFHGLQIEFLRSLYSDEKSQTRDKDFYNFQTRVFSVFQGFVEHISKG
jgi:N-formylglutamate deformylase